MSEPKSHHFVPKAYLDSFANSDGKIFVYDKNKNEFREQNPKETATENYRYTLIDEKGQKDNTLEKLFSKIEDKSINLIRKIDEGKKIEGEEYEVLASFITLQFTRVPQFQKMYDEFLDKSTKEDNKRNFDSIDKVIEFIKSFEKQTGEQIGISPEELFNDLHSEEKYQFKSTKDGYIRMMIDATMNILGVLYNMNWIIMHSHNESSFITSDNPFCILKSKIELDFQGIANYNVMKIMPLSPKSLILVGNSGQMTDYKNLNKKETRTFNLCIAENMERHLFACNNSLLKSIVQKLENEQHLHKIST